jgi:hypothetical protein
MSTGMLYLNLKLSSAKLFYFSVMLWGFGAIMYLLEFKGGEGGRSMDLFYCLI